MKSQPLGSIERNPIELAHQLGCEVLVFRLPQFGDEFPEGAVNSLEAKPFIASPFGRDDLLRTIWAKGLHDQVAREPIDFEAPVSPIHPQYEIETLIVGNERTEWE